MIRQLDNGEYVISSRGVWLPGVYADEKAARYAFQFSDWELDRLQQERNSASDGRPIGMDDLRAMRQRREAS